MHSPHISHITLWHAGPNVSVSDLCLTKHTGSQTSHKISLCLTVLHFSFHENMMKTGGNVAFQDHFQQ